MMMCVTSLLSGDVAHVQITKFVLVRDDAEKNQVLAYLAKIKGYSYGNPTQND